MSASVAVKDVTYTIEASASGMLVSGADNERATLFTNYLRLLEDTDQMFGYYPSLEFYAAGLLAERYHGTVSSAPPSYVEGRIY